MTTTFTLRRSRTFVLVGIGLLGAVALAVVPAAAADAVTSIDGPVNLGTATTFAVLGGDTVTNTGTSTVTGDLGVSPGTSITGIPSPGVLIGTEHATDQVAGQAQDDLTTAFNVAASLTPMTSGLDDLVGLRLVPGVYSGGALSLSGDLTLDGGGDPSAVWVFQAASTLVTGSGTHIDLINGASACNVFWEVGSSATLGTNSQFVGTILSQAAITATTGAQVTGRLLARTTAVTLDTNVVTRPTGCASASGTTVSVSPQISSTAPPAARVGTPYSFRVTATGTGSPTFAVTSGALPAGIVLNATTGVLTGTPTTAGRFAFTITASSGSAPSSSAAYVMVVARPGQGLALTGVDPTPGLLAGLSLTAAGLILILSRTRRAIAHRRR